MCGAGVGGTTGRGGGDNPRAAGFGDLGGIMPHRRAGAGDENCLGLDGLEEIDGMHGCQRGYAKTGACRVVDIRGQRDRLRFRQHDRLGSRAEGASPLAVPNPDTLADATVIHARPD